MKKFDLIIILTLAVLLFASFADGQGRSNRIYRPCPGSATPASVTLNPAGDVLFTPCSGGSISTPAGSPVRIYDSTYTPFQNATNLLSIGSDNQISPASDKWFISLDHNLPLTLSHTATAFSMGIRNRMAFSGSPVAPSIIGIHNDLITNGFTPSGTSTIYGVLNNVDIGFPVTTAYGVHTTVSHGGLGAGGSGTMIGTFSAAGMGHNGDLTTAIGGRFRLNSSASSASITTNAYGLQSQMTVNSGITVTNWRGLSLDTIVMSGGVVSNSYGIYADASIDVGSTSKYFIYSLSTSPSFLSGKLTFDTSDTAAATTGNQTISKPAFSVNFAAGTSSLVVTNSFITANSYVLCTVQTNDATALLKNASPAAGSVTIRLNANATAETRVACLVNN
jgi:hypothetical protein